MNLASTQELLPLTGGREKDHSKVSRLEGPLDYSIISIRLSVSAYSKLKVGSTCRGWERDCAYLRMYTIQLIIVGLPTLLENRQSKDDLSFPRFDSLCSTGRKKANKNIEQNTLGSARKKMLNYLILCTFIQTALK
jgi:hypothetical protein